MECNVQLAMGNFGKQFTGKLEFYPLFLWQKPIAKESIWFVVWTFYVQNTCNKIGLKILDLPTKSIEVGLITICTMPTNCILLLTMLVTLFALG
jgi:hypothetical protein